MHTHEHMHVHTHTCARAHTRSPTHTFTRSRQILLARQRASAQSCRSSTSHQVGHMHAVATGHHACSLSHTLSHTEWLVGGSLLHCDWGKRCKRSSSTAGHAQQHSLQLAVASAWNCLRSSRTTHAGRQAAAMLASRSDACPCHRASCLQPQSCLESQRMFGGWATVEHKISAASAWNCPRSPRTTHADRQAAAMLASRSDACQAGCHALTHHDYLRVEKCCSLASHKSLLRLEPASYP